MYAQFGSTLAQTWLSIGRGDTASEAHKECESISSSFLVCVCPPAVLDSLAVLTFAFASLFFFVGGRSGRKRRDFVPERICITSRVLGSGVSGDVFLLSLASH